MNTETGKVSRICRQPVMGDRLIDQDGELWIIESPMTLRIAEMAIDDGMVFVYEC